jgi:hypothetical protein
MDVFPWPDGHGFQGTQEWWDHVLSQAERKRLDQILGMALLDETFCRRLLKDCDPTFLAPFDLTTETQAWLRAIQAGSLEEFAKKVIAGPQRQIQERAS